ncbi:helix-turn-helix domain-containing protein [Sphaerimonospora thailandensis]|uniref:Transcriptional regulator n=1 Tax=Sphaerimonospora thailandensis TaxID=795644 RepID=A0A8J3W226_9ACTN|nr:helix-turn-helix transcriptional regulator [Sphaerimonospora thailandensis]GIH72723.1 transcriptional regulator [Sphaerimonospora thailandensis]
MDAETAHANSPAVRSPARWEEFGRRLRHWRRRAGLTQAQVGIHVGYDHSAISKLEGGSREPSPRLVRRLDDLLGTGGELQAAYTAAALPGQAGTGTGSIGLSLSTPLPGDGRALLADMEILETLSWPSHLPSYGLACPLHDTAGCAVPVPAEALSTYLASCAFDQTSPPPQSIDADAVHVLAALLAAYWQAADERVAAVLVTVVEHALHAIVRWTEVLAGPYRRALLSLAAGYAQLAAVLRMQRGQHGMAAAWFGGGLRWAAMAEDLVARVSLLGDMSTLARLENDPQSALAYARGIRAAGPDRPWVAALADLYEARAHGLGGDAAECHRHIAHARVHLTRFGERDELEAPWLCGAAGHLRVESSTGGALRDIAVVTANRSVAGLAVQAIERSLRHLPPHMRPARVMLTLRLADGYACAGNVETALVVAESVLADAVAVPTTMISQELRGLRDRMVARWGGRPDVRDFAARAGGFLY